jgi:hypothetical protein
MNIKFHWNSNLLTAFLALVVGIALFLLHSHSVLTDDEFGYITTAWATFMGILGGKGPTDETQ